MRRSILFLFTIVISLNFCAEAQIFRSLGLSGISYSLSDPEVRLTPFGLARNPATIVSDEQSTYLKIIPSYTSEQGEYRRLYDPEVVSLSSVNFRGLKTLGEKGTFLGEMGYVYEYRDQVYRSIMKDPYSGESFFMTDTTKGNISYNGPQMTGMYSWYLTDGLSAGFSVSYGILSGLKSVYTYAKTIYRNAALSGGLAYDLTDNTMVAVKLAYGDSQESVEASDVNLLDVEVWDFVGETYTLRNRSQSITQKVKRIQYETSLQVYSTPVQGLEIGANAGYSPKSATFITPYMSFDELTLGYSQSADIFGEVYGRYMISENSTAGAKVSYNHINNWSKNNRNNLLVWEWNYSGLIAGAGTSYKLTEVPLLMAVEFETAFRNIDSSKYIDRKSITDNGADITLRTGLEYEINSDLTVRGGYRFSQKGIDMQYGLKDVTQNQFSFGCDYYFRGGSILQFCGKYSNLTPSSSGVSRSVWEGFCQIKLNTF